MRIVFAGTPDFAADILSSLIASDIKVAGVITRPDTVRKRGNAPVPSPVKEVALEAGIDVLEAASLRCDDAQAWLCGKGIHALAVAAYGAILPREVLKLPHYGCINVHASLLPRWRGAAPIERAMLAGDELTGISIMRMEEGLDTGPFCLQEAVRIEGLTKDELEAELARKGGPLLVKALHAIEDGSAEWTPQDESGVTYAQKLEPGELDWQPDDAAKTLVAKANASSAAHACHAVLAGREASVQKARIPLDIPEGSIANSLAPGELAFTSKRLFAQAHDGTVEILALTPSGKKSMDAAAFAAGIQGFKNSVREWSSVHGL